MKKIAVLLAILVFSVVLSTFTVSSALEFEGFEYEIVEGQVTIINYHGSEVNVVIPETIDSCPVTVIGETAFVGNTTLESITLPASVKQVKCLLDSCANLKRIYIPDIAFWFETQFAGNLLTGGRELYVNGVLLEDLVIPENMTEVTFTGYSHLKTVRFHSNVQKVNFYGCDGIRTLYVEDIAAWCAMDFGGAQENPLYYAEELYVAGQMVQGMLTIPEGVTKIGDYTFSSFSGFRFLWLQKDVSDISVYAFMDCPNLETVMVNDLNPTYTARDGVLFNKTETELVLYPCAKSETAYTTPETVTKIGAGAFRSCKSLKEITVGDNVETIGMTVFMQCPVLEKVTIGKGVKSVDQYAFYMSPNLKVIEAKDLTAFCQIQVAMEAGPFQNGAALHFGGESVGNLVIPDSVVGIDNELFENCTSLESIAIHKGVTEIKAAAFKGCENITDVWYIGSEEERGSLQIKDGNDALVNALWHYDACPVGAEHDLIWVVDVPEGCGDDGLQHEECTACHMMQSQNTKLPANGNHVYDNAEDSSCNVCNQTREAGHNFRWVTEIEPTCATEGSKYEKCTHCDEMRNIGTVIPALKHVMGQWVIIREAACETKGEITRECALCGHKETDFLVALEHNYVPAGISQQPTCTEDGKDVAKCTLCGGEKITVLKAPGHKFNSVVLKEATEEENGIRRKTCEVCNTVKDEPIPANRQVGGDSQSVWMIILAVVVLLGSGAGIFFIIKTRDKE